MKLMALLEEARSRARADVLQRLEGEGRVEDDAFVEEVSNSVSRCVGECAAGRGYALRVCARVRACIRVCIRAWEREGVVW